MSRWGSRLAALERTMRPPDEPPAYPARHWIGLVDSVVRRGVGDDGPPLMAATVSDHTRWRY